MRFSGPDEALFRSTLHGIGLDPEQVDADIVLSGEEPALLTPHRVIPAGSLALAAQGAAIAALWRQRSGRAQRVEVNARDVVFALNPFPWLRRNGHAAHHIPDIMSPCSGYFRSGDGRDFYVTANYPRLRDGMLKLLDCPNDRAAVAAAIARWKAIELENAVIERNLVACMVRTREEWRTHAQGRYVAQLPLVEIEKIGDAPPRPLGPAERPLSGVRVLDMTHVFAGPTLTRGLAEQGADVLHVGTIHPDLVDALGITLETGIGKRSAIIDLRLPEDVQTFGSLLAGADVFVQSWRPGQLARKGFSPQRAAELRPGIIYVTVTCFGAGGPWGSRGGFDGLALAVSGMTHDEAEYDQVKLTPPGILTDGIVGFLGAGAVAAALARRAREGGSYHIKLSLSQAAAWIQGLGRQPRRTAADPGRPRTLYMESPFGTLEYVAPALRYSDTPGYFDKPPVPVGSSPPEWLPAH
jgi:crotonobetainyl-CoA:carnitine CoA-transferase CaiB-like acyl-CoA transferase